MSDKKTKKFEDRIVPTFLVYELATMANGFAGEDGKKVQYKKTDFFLITDDLNEMDAREGVALQLTGRKAGEKVKYTIDRKVMSQKGAKKYYAETMKIDSEEQYTGAVTYRAKGIACCTGDSFISGIKPTTTRFDDKYITIMNIIGKSIELNTEQYDKVRAEYCNDKLREEAECDVAELMADKN
ncbi:MAG: hypothetical protein E7356_01305 [Clostridiales bacterium]|nr:hypothetical protein [Clostridiales bacterium]